MQSVAQATVNGVPTYAKHSALRQNTVSCARSANTVRRFFRLSPSAGRDKDSEFLERVVKCTRSQAVFYPDFLKPPCDTVLTERLTESETQVLRLLCADKSNAEIGEILDIKLATVKSHVSHILQKLGVSRRSEAKTAAHKLRII